MRRCFWCWKEATLPEGMVLYGGHAFALCSDCHGEWMQQLAKMQKAADDSDGPVKESTPCICYKGESSEGVLEDCPIHGEGSHAE